MAFSLPAVRGLLRSLTIGFGLASVLWGMYTFPVFVTTAGADAMAFRVAAGEPFKRETLQAALPATDLDESPTRASYFRSLAIIRLRLTELGPAGGDPARSEAESKALEVSVVKALEREPADAYLWLVLSSLRMTNSTLPESGLAALRLSYLCGPREGWVAAVRNRFVMGVFSSVPEAIQEDALKEFKLLVASGYAKQTAEIFAGAGLPIRDRLMAQVANVPRDAKQKFADALHDLNDAVTVPGVVYSDHRHAL